jgi:hypothetical protein
MGDPIKAAAKIAATKLANTFIPNLLQILPEISIEKTLNQTNWIVRSNFIGAFFLLQAA